MLTSDVLAYNLTSIITDMNEIKRGVEEMLAQLEQGFADAHRDVLLDRAVNVTLAVLIPVLFFVLGFVSVHSIHKACHRLASHRGRQARGKRDSPYEYCTVRLKQWLKVLQVSEKEACWRVKGSGLLVGDSEAWQRELLQEQKRKEALWAVLNHTLMNNTSLLIILITLIFSHGASDT